ncbi:DinB family protein [Streptomyces sp. NPDC003006]
MLSAIRLPSPRPALAVRREGAVSGSWLEVIASNLDYHRAAFLWKCEGLSDAQLRLRPVRSSALTLLGLMRHMQGVERAWFQRALACTMPCFFPYRTYVTADGGDWYDESDATPARDVYEDYLTACEESRQLFAEMTVDLARIVPNPEVGETDVGFVLEHAIEEYARHVGHAVSSAGPSMASPASNRPLRPTKHASAQQATKHYRMGQPQLSKWPTTREHRLIAGTQGAARAGAASPRGRTELVWRASAGHRGRAEVQPEDAPPLIAPLQSPAPERAGEPGQSWSQTADHRVGTLQDHRPGQTAGAGSADCAGGQRVDRSGPDVRWRRARSRAHSKDPNSEEKGTDHRPLHLPAPEREGHCADGLGPVTPRPFPPVPG